MSLFEWTLNCALLGWVLLRNLGTRQVTWRVLVVPLVLVAVAAAYYLRSIPTAGHDLTMELLGAAAGAALGAAATAVTTVRRDENGRVLVGAGLRFAALWIVAIGGRIAFAQLASGPWGPAVARFSVAHQITGADAWRSTFVLMAVAMVLGRAASTALVIRRARPAASLPRPTPAEA